MSSSSSSVDPIRQAEKFGAFFDPTAEVEAETGSRFSRSGLRVKTVSGVGYSKTQLNTTTKHGRRTILEGKTRTAAVDDRVSFFDPFFAEKIKKIFLLPKVTNAISGVLEEVFTEILESAIKSKMTLSPLDDMFASARIGGETGFDFIGESRQTPAFHKTVADMVESVSGESAAEAAFAKLGAIPTATSGMNARVMAASINWMVEKLGENSVWSLTDEDLSEEIKSSVDLLKDHASRVSEGHKPFGDDMALEMFTYINWIMSVNGNAFTDDAPVVAEVDSD